MRKMNRIVLLCLVAMLAALMVAPVAAQETADIPVWIGFVDYRLDWAREKAAEFNEAFPQYNVTVEGYGNYEELLDATVLAIEQGTTPAIVQWFEAGTQFARDSGYFRPVHEIVGDRTEINGIPFDTEDFVPPAMGYYSDNGVLASVPWNTSTPIMFANQDLLDEAGIEAMPTTWQELEAACETLANMEGGPEYCITWPNHGWFFENWLAVQNENLVNNDNGRAGRATEVNLTSDAAIDTVTWWQHMEDEGHYYYSGVQRDWNGTQQALYTGDVAFILTSAADVQMVTNTGAENGFEVVTGRYPYDEEDGWTGNIIGGGSMWVLNGLAPEVEEGAMTFLAWLTNTENAAEWHQLTGYVPIRPSAGDLLEEQGWFEENPNFFTGGDQLNNSQVTPATSGALLGTMVETRNVVTQAIEDLLLQGGDVTERLTQAQEEATTLLEEYNSLYVTE